MDHIIVNGYLYEAVDFSALQQNMKAAIDYLQQAKNSVSDKNQLRSIKACQTKIKKTYYKIKGIENDRYSAKFRPLSDEERLRNLQGIDAKLERQPVPDANREARRAA